MFQFFWSRAACVWIALLYVALGLPLLLFPDVSGTVFVWALAIGAAIYGVSHLWRYFQSREKGQTGDLFLGILPLGFSVFALLSPQAILSFLPIVLGALLLMDGVGKLPLMVRGIREKSPAMVPLIVSAVLPVLIGIVLMVNPFTVAKMVIMAFGLTLMADGVSDLITALLIRQSTSGPSGSGPSSNQ